MRYQCFCSIEYRCKLGWPNVLPAITWPTTVERQTSYVTFAKFVVRRLFIPINTIRRYHCTCTFYRVRIVYLFTANLPDQSDFIYLFYNRLDLNFFFFFISLRWTSASIFIVERIEPALMVKHCVYVFFSMINY